MVATLGLLALCNHPFDQVLLNLQQTCWVFNRLPLIIKEASAPFVDEQDQFSGYIEIRVGRLLVGVQRAKQPTQKAKGILSQDCLSGGQEHERNDRSILLRHGV